MAVSAPPCRAEAAAAVDGRALEFAFHVVFMCRKRGFFQYFFFQSFAKVKNIVMWPQVCQPLEEALGGLGSLRLLFFLCFFRTGD